MKSVLTRFLAFAAALVLAQCQPILAAPGAIYIDSAGNIQQSPLIIPNTHSLELDSGSTFEGIAGSNFIHLGTVNLTPTSGTVDLSSTTVTLPAATKALFAPATLSINLQTGTTYTGVLADAGKITALSNASAITYTVPTNASVAYPVGTVLTVTQAGAGTVTISHSGLTWHNATGVDTLAGQYQYVTLIKRATDTWDAFGGFGPLNLTGSSLVLTNTASAAMRLAYDGSNYVDVQVFSNGNILYNQIGGGLSATWEFNGGGSFVIHSGGLVDLVGTNCAIGATNDTANANLARFYVAGYPAFNNDTGISDGGDATGVTIGLVINHTGVGSFTTSLSSLPGNIEANTAGKTLLVKSGSNAKAGTFTLTASAATVANTSITAHSVVIPTLKTVGGTVGGLPYVDTITPGTGFTVAGGGGSNTSVYNYVIIEVD